GDLAFRVSSAACIFLWRETSKSFFSSALRSNAPLTLSAEKITAEKDIYLPYLLSEIAIASAPLAVVYRGSLETLTDDISKGNLMDCSELSNFSLMPFGD